MVITCCFASVFAGLRQAVVGGVVVGVIFGAVMFSLCLYMVGRFVFFTFNQELFKIKAITIYSRVIKMVNDMYNTQLKNSEVILIPIKKFLPR